MEFSNRPTSTQTNSYTGYLAAFSLAALGTGVTAWLTSFEVPKGSVGISEQRRTFEALEPGNYALGALFHRDVEIVALNQQQNTRVSLTFTPGNIDKLILLGRKSSLVSILPVVGEFTHEKMTGHVNLTLEVSYAMPSSNSVVSLARLSDTNDSFEKGIAELCHRAILPREEKLDNWVFKPNNESLETMVVKYLEEEGGLKNVTVKIIARDEVAKNSYVSEIK